MPTGTKLPGSRRPEDERFAHDPDAEHFDEMMAKEFSPEAERDMEDNAHRGADEDKELEKLKADENPKSIGNQDDVASQEEQPWATDVGTGKPSPAKGRFYKRKGVLGVIALALGSTGFGGFLLFTQLLQPIHVAQLLQKTHLQHHQDTADDRFYKLYKYISSGGRAEQTRLGIIGNKIADKVEKRFNDHGIKSAYTSTFGNFDGFAIDPKNPPDNLNGKSNAEIKSYYKSVYNVDVTDGPNGHLMIPSTDANGKPLGFFASRALIRDMLLSVGYSRLGAAIQSRVMGKRAGVTWHPMRKLELKGQTAAERFREWRKDRRTRLTQGADAPSLKVGQDLQTDKEGNPVDNTGSGASADDVEGSVEEAQEEAQEARENAADDPNASEEHKTSVKAKIAGGGVGAVGVVCMGKAVIDSSDEIRQATVVLPMMRMGWEAISLGNQMMHGKDVDIEQLSYFNRSLYDPESKLDWSNARSVQYESGQTPNGPDVDPQAKPNGIIEAFDFLDNTVVDAVCSSVGQFILTILGGPINLLIDLIDSALGVSEFLIEKLAELIAGEPIDLDAKGPKYGNYLMYGTLFASNDIAASGGGRILSNEEATNIRSVQTAYDKEEFEKQSLAYKLFNAYDSRSIAGQFAGSQSTLAYGLTNLFSTSGIINMFTPSTSFAANEGSYSYDIPKVGFSINEVNDPIYKNPYENARRAAQILDSELSDEYIERAKECFGMEIKKMTGESDEVWGVVSTGETVRIEDLEDNEDCGENNAAWKVIRVFVLDTGVMEAIGCYEGEQDSCNNVDFGASASTGGGGTSGGGEAASCGTARECAKKILDHPKIDFQATGPPDLEATAAGKPITACGLNGPLSAKLLAVILAIADKHPITINFFVSQHGCDGGYHPKGKAVDIDEPGVTPAIMRDIAELLPKGGGIGQKGCSFTSGFRPPAGIRYFADACNHVHIDIGDN